MASWNLLGYIGGMQTFSFKIPGNPVPKERPRVTNAHTYTPQRTLKAEKAIQAYALQARVKPLVGDLIVEIWFFRDNQRRCDIDNLAKLVLDSLNKVAWRDDTQIIDLLLYKRYDRENPRTEITITVANS